MTTRWGGGRSALLLAALLPAACMRTYEFDPAGGGGGATGSDAGAVGGGNGVNDGGGNSDGNHLHCNGSATPLSVNVMQERPGFFFALDRSRSMLTGLGTNNATRFSVARDAIISAVSSSPYSSLVPFGYYEFPTGDSSCSNNVCCAAGFPSKTGQSMNFSMALSQCSMSSQSLTCNTNSDSAPTGQALQKIANSWKQNSSNAPLYALLLTDGKPSDDCAFESLQSAGSACEQTTNLINDMNNGSTFSSPVTPITTIVIAVGGVDLDAPPPPSTPTYNSCLNKMAFAGGRPALNSPTAYTLASTEASVHTQIDTIITNAICTFDIDSSFDPKSQYEVDYNGSPIDQSNGYTLDRTRLTLTGSWCSTLMTAMKNSTHHNVTLKSCVDPSRTTPFPNPNP